MTPSERKLLEGYIDNIIDRCEKLTKVVYVGTIFIGLVILIFALGHSFANSWNLGVLEGTLFIMLMTLSVISWYLITHLYSCQNGCELIKVQMFSKTGGLDAASETIKNTTCTQNIDIKKLQTLIQPVTGGVS